MENNAKEKTIAKYYEQIYKFVLLQLKSKEQALDVTQEVFYRYLKFNKNFESDDYEKRWLYLTAANLCKSYWRSGWYKHVFLKNEEIEFSDSSSPVDDCLDKEESELIVNAILNLSYEERELVQLYYYDDMNIHEISKITGIKESTVQTKLSRAREKLKKTLKEVGYERY